jgi:hypothetical protein
VQACPGDLVEARTGRRASRELGAPCPIRGVRRDQRYRQERRRNRSAIWSDGESDCAVDDVKGNSAEGRKCHSPFLTDIRHGPSVCLTSARSRTKNPSHRNSSARSRFLLFLFLFFTSTSISNSNSFLSLSAPHASSCYRTPTTLFSSCVGGVREPKVSNGHDGQGGGMGGKQPRIQGKLQK